MQRERPGQQPGQLREQRLVEPAGGVDIADDERRHVGGGELDGLRQHRRAVGDRDDVRRPQRHSGAHTRAERLAQRADIGSEAVGIEAGDELYPVGATVARRPGVGSTLHDDLEQRLAHAAPAGPAPPASTTTSAPRTSGAPTRAASAVRSSGCCCDSRSAATRAR